MVKPVHILNGPNLNLLGKRQPDVYGHETLQELEAQCSEKAERLGLEIVFRQTNSEGDLVTLIQEARESASGILLNAGAYTHTSVAVLDALLACDQPVIEVHLSNPYAREDFRHRSFVSRAAVGVICGLGPLGYELALDALAHKIGS